MSTQFTPKIVLIDETSRWNDDIQERGGKLFAAYLFDASRATHCAEITPSYELHYLYTTSSRGFEDLDLQESIQIDGDGGEPFMYMHCKDVDRVPSSHYYVPDKKHWAAEAAEATDDESYYDLIDSVVDSYRANVQIQLPKGFVDPQFRYPEIDPRQLSLLTAVEPQDTDTKKSTPRSRRPG